MKRPIHLLIPILIPTLMACQLMTSPAFPTPTATIILPSPTPSETATATPSPSATPSLTPSPTETPIPSPTSTFAILRGKVNVEKASCRYGPGPMYLYLYGLNQGANQEVIGRTDTGTWVLTRARGDTTRCWVKTDLLDLNGDVMGVEMVYPDQYKLPVSPYYAAPYNVRATREGDKVTITWVGTPLRAGDEESPTSPLFVVETWLCRDGRLVFTPFGVYTEQVTVSDQPGCSQASHGRVFLAEKHGYAGPSEIPWPPYPSNVGQPTATPTNP